MRVGPGTKVTAPAPGPSLVQREACYLLACKQCWINATVDAPLRLVAPAQGALLRARGRVISAGKLLTVCAAEVYAVNAEGQETLCATLLGTARNIATAAASAQRPR